MLNGAERVALGKLRQHGQPVADPRVVFHRARTKWIELGIDRKVLLRQAGEMPHDLQFGNLRQQRRLTAQNLPGQICSRRIRRRMTRGTSARGGQFENYRLGHQADSELFMADFNTDFRAAANASIWPVVRASVAHTSSA